MAVSFRAARTELGRLDWRSYRAPEAGGPSVPEVFARLLDGGRQSDAAGYSLYGRLETQSMLYEIALPATGVILAALAGGRLEDWVEDEFLTILHTIVYSEPHRTEYELGNDDLAERCVAKARDGVWTLYGILRGSNAEFVLDILEAVDDDKDRLAAFRREHQVS
ncbi:hypothetical protein BJ973_008002 [Actinoplanes tereljensis]|uniref:Uncharacterized protein n=1 Tax=Paractinoplanes tereljensis TaxID=571912 RepID=A0A919NV65_9ACTN|nr:hypothetical protein [Actinoplanes tereljensis]GIF24524.1 hypothetical protein Ate02nite_72540 [Actinoplanes tereljensis]